jgi:hypothetical protein
MPIRYFYGRIISIKEQKARTKDKESAGCHSLIKSVDNDVEAKGTMYEL